MSVADNYKEIVKIMKTCSDTQNLYEVFTDFVKMMAYNISFAVDMTTKDERIKEYETIAKKYTKEQLEGCAQVLALVTSILEQQREDVFGRIYMELGFGDKLKAQEFTPTGISSIMAMLSLDKQSVEGVIKKEGFVSIEDSSCGGGSTIIQAVEELTKIGVNPQSQILVFANDLDFMAVAMCYVQLSLLGIPALIKQQDTLTLMIFSVWYTPFFILGNWYGRLRLRDAFKKMMEVMEEIEE